MSWFSRCSWCGGPSNGGNCQHCTNVSFGDEPVYDSNPNSYNQTPDISNLHAQPLTSSFNQFYCFHCKDPLEDGVCCQRCTCVRCGHYLGDGFCSFCNSEAGNSFVNDSNPNSFNDPPKFSDYPPQPQYETYSCELCENDSHHGYDCPPQFPLIKDYRNEKINIRFRRECENMIDELKSKFNGMGIEINKKIELQRLEDIISKLPLSVAITPDLPTLEPEDSLIMGNEDLSTIPEKESDEFIKSSVEDHVPIPSESKDTSESTDIKEMDIIKAKTEKTGHEKERVHKSRKGFNKSQQWLNHGQSTK
ncbi:hypothetical protein Tco_1088930 [Tanacetum coccineum]